MWMVLIEISNNLKPLECQTMEEHAEMLVIPEKERENVTLKKYFFCQIEKFHRSVLI